MKRILIPLFSFFLINCGEDPIPKPKGYLSLDYPIASYKRVTSAAPFSFKQNTLSEKIKLKDHKEDESYSLDIEYPSLKGTIYLTYKKVTKTNLKKLLRDTQNLTQKHTLKADEIISEVFENKTENVYGMFYKVGGNAASQSQFYATDSINHFISGSLYFYAKPNYDSIYPAAIYLRNDIKKVMESLKWKK